ncbi:Uncharacterised protein [Vibrio cholerae]|nr:Uncharacterised protein [Vibrio cholerae]CSC06143.1 Uncharacterised protein [Vibrio cholerae]CSC95696.1 Uncharacterised protein [Vibrio cholerae]CSD17559.1 Uncharacterised protein [Vibrio cholerae]CSD22405.1 Uncharacterised protein [Vibrio cholerae]
MAVLVISCFLLRIGQNFIRFFDFFKLFRRTSISRVAVRVVFHRKAFVCLFNITLGGVTAYA